MERKKLAIQPVKKRGIDVRRLQGLHCSRYVVWKKDVKNIPHSPKKDFYCSEINFSYPAASNKSSNSAGLEISTTIIQAFS